MLFILINSSYFWNIVHFQEIEMARHIVISRFGLMHMIATNLCEWLYVLVEETKHEIIHLGGTC